MPGRILLIAFHFPPIRISSGIQRTLKFATYLREFGWDPMVLTVNPRAYEVVGEDQMREIPPDMPVERAFCLDTARHLGIRGRYLSWMAQPDRWVSWVPFGMARGWSMVRRYKPDVILSTSPIVSAHLLGMGLSSLTGLPWVADLRDSITEPNYPRDPRTWRVHRRIEAALVGRATRLVFTAEGTRAMYRARYPEAASHDWAVIENGYDEDNFRAAEAARQARPSGADAAPLTLVHSGILYPHERNPGALFAALAMLKKAGQLTGDRFRLVLRATAHDALYRPMLSTHDIADLVELAPSISYQEALGEMLASDGLLILQGSICNDQIPAKLYEYFRSGRPILGLVDPVGNTAEKMRVAGARHIASIDDPNAIAKALMNFLAAIGAGEAGVAPAIAREHSRRGRTRALASLLDAVVAPPTDATAVA